MLGTGHEIDEMVWGDGPSWHPLGSISFSLEELLQQQRPGARPNRGFAQQPRPWDGKSRSGKRDRFVKFVTFL